jgi:hypothetical protein
VGKALGTLAFMVILGLATPAWAQRRQSAFSTINPSDIRYTRVDTGEVVTLASLGQPRSSSLSRFLPSIPLSGFFSRRTSFLPKTTIGTSNLPPPSAFPSTHYKSPLQPVMPFIPGK